MPEQKVGHYHLKEPIGRGGMGEVFRALDTRLNREVALKFLSPALREDPGARHRLLREARAASALDHPAVCTVYEVGETEDGRTYISMPYYRGITLKQRIARGPVPFSEALSLCVEVADALYVVHEKGILHLDIKPANLILTDDGRVKILDFGIAHTQYDPDIPEGKSQPMGTVHYMAPERLRNDEPGPESDVWSLGIIFYLLVTGVLPFRGESAQAVSTAILNLEIPPPSTLNPDLPLAIDRFMADALNRDPHQRLPEMRAFATGLRRLSSRGEDGPDIEISPSPARPSIAILPIDGLGGVEDYICSGMTNEIIHALSHVEGLRVIARHSVDSLSEEGISIRDLGQRLGCGFVLRGSVQASDRKIRVHVQLINVSDGATIWSERMDGHSEEILVIQDEISLAVMDALKIRLIHKARNLMGARRTPDMKSYHLYLRGLFHLNHRTPVEINRGCALLEESVLVDPHYAPSLAGLADGYMIQASYEAQAPGPAFRKARELVVRALAEDDQLALAHSTRAVLEWEQEADRFQAEKHFRRALSLAPGLADTHHRYAEFLGALGRFDEAFREIRTALDQDPLALLSHVLHGYLHYLRRNFTGAMRLYRAVAELDPNFITLCCEMGMTHIFMEEWDEGIRMLEKTAELGEEHPMYMARLAFGLARAGRREEAERIGRDLNQLEKQSGISSFSLFLLHLGLGEMDSALKYLERAWEERFYHVLYLATDPIFEEIIDHPRVERLIRELTASAGDNS